MRAAALCCAAVILASAVLAADDHCVLVDEDVDFSAFKTFALRDAGMKSERPELKFPAIMKTIGDAISTALTARGLKAATDRPDLTVEYSVNGVDWAIGSFGRPNEIRPGRGGRGGRASSAQADFTEATLVIDMKPGDAGALVWRGVFHDTENDARKLAETLPKDAATLLSYYPKKK